MKYKEIETKYNADDIDSADFQKIALSLNPTRELFVSSNDHYYTRDDGLALRYREGKRPELTVKQKSKDHNNFVRTEVNLALAPDVELETVTELATLQGYKHNFTIYKTCMIYFWDRHNVVMYVVFDHTQKNILGTFIEIELLEDEPWGSVEEAWAYLREIEKAFEPLGISPAKRLRRSLLEMFKRE